MYSTVCLISVWIADNFTWLYIGSQAFWLVFIVVIYFSNFSNLKLGKPTDVPDYNVVTWFMMIFTCGCGSGNDYIANVIKVH